MSNQIAVIGNVCVDLIAEVSEEFLAQHGLVKSACTMITKAQQVNLLSATSYQVFPGGCGGNTASAMALLGLDVVFTGPFAGDPHGEIFRNSLMTAGVSCHGFVPGNPPAQSVFTFITPDGERSFACFYDQTTRMDDNALRRISSIGRYIVLDGYSLLFAPVRDQLIHILTCTELVRKVILCPNDLSVIENGANSVQDFFGSCGSFVMNEAEYTLLTSPHGTIKHLINNESPRMGAVTRGADGAILSDQTRSISIPTLLNSTEIINTNGAGDAFTAGYLYGLVHGFTLENTGWAASLCAAAVTRQVSPRLSRDDARLIVEKLAELG